MATTGTPLWLDRFVEPTPIRREGAFHIYAARHAQSREPRVVITNAPDADPLAASATLDKVARAHRAVVHPRVPKVDERGRVGEVEFISLRSSAVVDFESVWALHTKQSGDRVPYGLLLGVGHEIIDAVITAHRTPDPETGAPICVGVFSPANILLSEDGRASLLGIGAYTTNATADGRPTNPLGVFVAPEVAAGGEPSPSGDVYGFFSLIRSLLPYVKSPPAMDRVLRGAPEPDDMELAGKLGEAQMRALAPMAVARFKTLEEFSSAYDEVWHLAGIQPDAVGFRSFVMDLIPRVTHAGAIRTTTSGGLDGAVHAGRYRVERRLGKGGSGNVFLAWDRELKQRVALKLLKSEKRAELQDRFLREVRILREVRHPHLVRGYDLLVDGDTLGAVLEYVPGLELDEHLAAHPEQREDLAVALADVAAGLAALHDAGVVHRDVKPSNLVVHKERGPVLVDFGVAAEVGSERPLTRTGEMVGTPLYMAPEQLRGDRVGPSVDVYGLAVVLVEGVTGAHPFPTADVPRALELRETTPAVDALNDRIREITARALDPDPERRPTARELAVAWRGERRQKARAGAPAKQTSPGLVISRDGRAYRLEGGDLVNLQRRKAVRLILVALAEARVERPGEAIDLEKLQEIGWPGENMLPEAGANRAYVALSAIRKMGFKDSLLSRDDGYLFDPGFPVELSDEL
jgi:serine/threonine protein kinase